MAEKNFTPIHPGEILLEDFLKPMGITPGRLAGLIGVDRRRTLDIVRGQRDISTDTAMRLGRLFSMSPDFWMNLQRHYDMDCARDKLWKSICATVRPLTLSDSSGKTGSS